jgi:DNA gyrase subunit A
VRFAAPDADDAIVAVARNAERAVEAELENVSDGGADSPASGVDAVPSSETNGSQDDNGGQQ